MRIGTKLTLALLVPLVVAMAAFATISISREEEVHLREVREEAERIARTLALPAAEILGRGEAADLRALAERSALHRDRFGLVFYDRGGQPLATWGLSEAQGALPRLLRREELDRGYAEELMDPPQYSYVAAVRRPGAGRVGAVRASVSLAEAKAILRNERLYVVGMVVAAVVLTALVTSLGVRRTVSAPLGRLARVLGALGRGEAVGDLPARGTDEVSALAREVNAMARRLREAQERLVGEKEAVRNIFESISDGIVVLDRAGRVTTWNRAMERRYEVAAASVVGRPLLEAFPVLRGEGLEGPLQALLEGKEEAISLPGFEHETLHRGRATLNIRGTVLRDTRGESMGAVLAVEDVTERVALEREVQQAEKLAAVGQLAAGIAHQIGTPLNVISGSAEYLMMEGGEKGRMPELDVIVAQTERIAKLIQQLLNFARPARLQLEALDLNGLLQDVLGLAEPQIAKERIQVVSDLSPDLPKLRGDPNQLEQAFLNIVVNAWHAMSEGGILTITTRVKGQGAGDRGGPAIEVTIADTGCGIPPENLDRIFDPFFSTKGVGKGTGLGLAISRRIIEDHGGRVRVASTPGRGTGFTVAFALPEEAQR